jgi:formylglycine-generating enzyme required for sulfatase activity
MPDAFTNSIGMKFVRIEPGTFLMGQGQGGDWDERPIHKVTITKPFYMAVTEVTYAQFEQFDSQHRKLHGKLGFSNDDNETVVFVSWHEAAKFCEWLSKKEGRPYRLPTEAEWEYACRAGTTTTYNTGDTLPENYHKNQVETWEPKPLSLHVAKTPPNPWGLFDMHGNLEEWCCDWYGPYQQGDQTDPIGYAAGDFKVTRSGSYNTPLQYLRSANRLGTLPEDKSNLIGFRVVIAELPNTKPLSPFAPPLNRQNVSQATPPDLTKSPDTDKPFFKGPIEYVKVPPGSDGPMFSKHNHDPAIVACPNGDLLAIWYSCKTESGCELTILASRLRYGSEQWEPASVFWDAPDRNDHAPALWCDSNGTIYHFNGLSSAATWGNLALIMRTSTDNGVTWSKAQFISPEHTLRHQPVQSVIKTQDGSIILPCDAVSGGSGGTAVHISRDNGKTWNDPGVGQTQPKFANGSTGAWIAGIHAAIVHLKDGTLMALGRGNNIDGRMPMSLSKDMGQTWTYLSSEFTPIGGGQRLVLRRLQEGPILLVSFTDPKQGMLLLDSTGAQCQMFGMFAALSFDEGKTWPVKRLLTAGGLPRQIDGGGNTGRFLMDDTHAEPKGYLAITQAPNGLIHLITSKQHYVFNLAWLKQLTQKESILSEVEGKE